MADLLMVHPALEPGVVRRLVGEYWPDGDLRAVPEGYLDITAAFHSMRVFVREARLRAPVTTDPQLRARVREWVDGLARTWAFSEVFRARDIDFWVFFRDPLITWLHELIAERGVIERLAAGEPLALVAVGLDPHRIRLLRALGETRGTIRAEIAYALAPPAGRRESATERRLRRLFFLMQDGWHGVQLLLEDLLVRRPKVLLVSDSHCWQRRARREAGWTRTDVYLEEIWREGRRRPLRLYYRTDSYHPDVGAMTRGRLAPTNLHHFLFLLDQTSRGFWELRNIHRQWHRLKSRDDFRESLDFAGLRLDEFVTSWIDDALAGQLPARVRATRRELHFLRGLRPNLLIVTREQAENRAILLAAKRLRIPTVALQMHPFDDRDHAYLLAGASDDHAAGRADRLCVFGAAAKKYLVEKGGWDPSMVAVSGDPRLDAPQRALGMDPLHVDWLRKSWGVENGRKIIAVVGAPAHCPEIMAWVSAAVARRSDVFVLLRSSGDVKRLSAWDRCLGAVPNLRWFHLDESPMSAGWLGAADLLVTDSPGQMAEGLLLRTPVAWVQADGEVDSELPDPGALVQRVRTPEELAAVVAQVLSGAPARVAESEEWRAFVSAVYGWGRPGASARVLDAAQELMRAT